MMTARFIVRKSSMLSAASVTAVEHRLFVNNSTMNQYSKKTFSYTSSSNSAATRTTALIIGSSGALGSSMVSSFHKNQIVSNIIGVDLVQPSADVNKCLSHFISLRDVTTTTNNESFLNDLTNRIKSGLQEYSSSSDELDVIICTAGGFVPTPDYSNQNDYIHGVEEMIRQNLYPVIVAAHLAATRLKPGGLFIAFGAASALGPTQGTLAYGISKNAVHHIVQTLGCKGEFGKRADQIEPTVVALLPIMLDTPTNRANAPEGAGYSNWTKTEHIAEEIGLWITTPDLRPNSGSLVKVFRHQKSGKAVFRLVR